MTARRDGRRRNPGRGTACLALLLAAGSAAAQDVGVPGCDAAEPLSLVLATWRAEALGRLATGAVGWVAASDGALRLDLIVDATPGQAPGVAADPWPGLLAREGRGWTLVAPPRGDGVYGAWDREWSAPPPGLAALARGVARWSDGAHAAGAGSGGGESFILAAAAVAAADVAAGQAGPEAPGLRRELAGRARGGGGPGERVRMGPLAGGGVEVRSSRRPGRLVVSPRETRPTSATCDEVFLPWWSLGEILELPPPAESGTSCGQAR